MNLSDVLTESARRDPGKLALVSLSGAARLTYGDLLDQAAAVARALAARGLQPGDRVALGMHNIPAFAASYFGILMAGGVVVPLNVMLQQQETRHVLTDSGARMLLTAPPYSAIAVAAAGEAGIEDVITTEGWDELPQEGELPEHGRGGDDLAVLAYTSGTTGEPKGAMLSHRNLLANLDQQMQIPDAHVTSDDVLFLSLPLFHIYGLNVTLGLTVMNGATGILVERFEPINALRAIEEHKVSVLFGAPTMYSAWVNTPGADQYDLSSVRLAISGAAPLPESTLHAFENLFGVVVYEGYGLTETSPTLWSNRMAERPRPGSVGKPLPGIEFRLIDEDGNDAELGDPGEIVVRGPNVFQGYWNRPKETEDAFFHGWFRTGDIGVLDEEGYLYLVDRKRDLIIVSGFNVYPSEVEEALLRDPKIAEAAVIGEPHPYTGEAVKAFVVLAGGASATEEELIASVQSRLARFKCPTSISIVENLPQLLTGKVLRRALRT